MEGWWEYGGGQEIENRKAGPQGATERRLWSSCRNCGMKTWMTSMQLKSGINRNIWMLQGETSREKSPSVMKIPFLTSGTCPYSFINICTTHIMTKLNRQCYGLGFQSCFSRESPKTQDQTAMEYDVCMCNLCMLLTCLAELLQCWNMPLYSIVDQIKSDVRTIRKKGNGLK